MSFFPSLNICPSIFLIFSNSEMSLEQHETCLDSLIPRPRSSATDFSSSERSTDWEISPDKVVDLNEHDLALLTPSTVAICFCLYSPSYRSIYGCKRLITLPPFIRLLSDCGVARFRFLSLKKLVCCLATGTGLLSSSSLVLLLFSLSPSFLQFCSSCFSCVLVSSKHLLWKGFLLKPLVVNKVLLTG